MTVIERVRMTVKMQVPHPVMIMVVQVPPLPNQFQAEHRAEHDEHESHDDLRRNGERAGYRDTKDEHDRAYEQQNGGMPDAPAEAHQTRCLPGRPFGKYRRDGDEMVRIQGVTQSEDKSKAQNRHVRGISHSAPRACRGLRLRRK